MSSNTAASGLAGNAAAVGVLRAKGFSGEVTVIPQFGVDPLIFAPAADRRAFNRPAIHDWICRAIDSG